jgi:hypothetical protein
VISETELRDVRAHCGHYSRNLVTEHRRHWNDIVSSEKQVGVAQASGLHVDENFAPNRRGNAYILKVEPAAECVNYECLHVWPSLQQGLSELPDVIVRDEGFICPRPRCYNFDALEVSIWSCGICVTLLESGKSSISGEQQSGSTSHSRRFPAKYKIWRKKLGFACSSDSLAALN